MWRNNPNYIQAREVMARYSTLNIEFSTPPEGKEPWLNDDGSFLIIYSPKKLKLRKGLLLENLDWMSRKTKHSTIQVDILKKDFYNMVNVNKNQALLYIFLINQKSN